TLHFDNINLRQDQIFSAQCDLMMATVKDNISVILLSEIVWDKFRPNTGCFEPLLLHFPDYSKGELQQILSTDRHPSYSAEFYSSYINMLLGVFYPICRDLRELRHLAALNFSKFCEPVAAGKVKETDTHKLWKYIEPHLKKAMQTVYLREVSSLQWEQMEEHETGALRGLSAHTHVELPYYSKFLLIAAYLASYNPARTDKRFFLKHHGKIRKTNFLKKNEKVITVALPGCYRLLFYPQLCLKVKHIYSLFFRRVTTFWGRSPSLWTACSPFSTAWWTAESLRLPASSPRSEPSRWFCHAVVRSF
ncbi:Origin recognition complex subunit 5, partial [Goodea atripinnis]